jgi:primosomal protein N' (replication factor Y)
MSSNPPNTVPSAKEIVINYVTPSEQPINKPDWVNVLVDIPFGQSARNLADMEEQLFTYKIPAGLNIQLGDIVSVPFGQQLVGAIAIKFIDTLPDHLSAGQIREIADVIASGFFRRQYWQLLEQVAEYYQTSLIKVIRTALPSGLLQSSQRRIKLLDQSPEQLANQLPNQRLSDIASQIITILEKSPQRDYTWQHIERQVKGAKQGLRELLNRGLVSSYLASPKTIQAKLKSAVIAITNNPDLTKRQQEVWAILMAAGGEMWLEDLVKQAQTTPNLIKTLQTKGYLVIEQQEVLRSEQGRGEVRDQPKVLTVDQQKALETIQQINSFAQILLHGVTGSGKTEVYLQAIAPILARGESALVLVPEIGLTPQLTDRFRARFGKQVYVYHSSLSAGERYDTWRNMMLGKPQIVVGTRSAVFAPLPKLGLIILDEEHDSSFKQDERMPCYHARTVAKWRAVLEQCPLVLGSATPAIETWCEGPAGARGDQYYLSLPERVESRPLPTVQIVDMRRELHNNNRSIFSRTLQQALKDLKSQGQQGILFIHRRGHHTFISCRSCGYVMECPHCDVSLAYHYTRTEQIPLLKCHYCHHTAMLPSRCPECDSPYFKYFGSGTQRIETELNQMFPDLSCIRFDSDTTNYKDAHRILLDKFAAGEADLLIGTQMLTKGLDLAQVTLVGVVSADGLLHLSDFRANERAMQTLLQVAGRAGRGAEAGRVIVQTYTPEHPVIEAVQRHNYDSFINTELGHREFLHYPPYGRLILLRLSSADNNKVANTAQQITDQLKARLKNQTGYQVLGPAPAPVLRVANRYRWHILLKLPLAAEKAVLNLHLLQADCPAGVSLTIDVDPLHL